MIKILPIGEFTPADTLHIWDVRDAQSHAGGHIAHAINVPLDTLKDATLAQAKLDSTTGDIYVLCGGGTKAQRACELLEHLDPSRTYVHLTGGTRGAAALGWQLASESVID